MKYITVFCILIYALNAQINERLKYPTRPGEREFISDNANFLTVEQEKRIRQKLDKLLDDKAVPIVVVTIDSLAKYNVQYYGEYGIRHYAGKLFNHWGIGHSKIRVRNNQEVSWNKGILLLISSQDRLARIELGADYGSTKNSLCRQIMDDYIIFYFKEKKFAKGIEAGVDALEKMARGEKIPNPPRPTSHYLLVVVFIALAIFTFVSLARHGTSGWAWIFWGIVFSILGSILLRALTSRNSSGSSGFSGGSFGGGFSGGGGASGSW